MTPLPTLLCTLALATTATAFTAAPVHRPLSRNRPLSPLFGLGEDKGGGSAIATPKTKTVTTTVTQQEQKSKKKKFKPSDPESKLREEFEDAPMFRLYYVSDEADDQTHVVTKLHEVVEDCSEDNAAEIFKSAQQTGEAFMGKYPKEIAETYAEQLTRSDPIIFADVRDNENK